MDEIISRKCKCKSPIIVGIVVPFAITILYILGVLLLILIEIKMATSRMEFGSIALIFGLFGLPFILLLNFVLHLIGLNLALFAPKFFKCDSICKVGLTLNASFILIYLAGYAYLLIAKPKIW